MYPFSQSVTPAVRTHLDAQTAFMNDMSKSLFHSFQQMCNLNLQLVQTMMEETTHTGQQVLTAERQTDALSAAASRAQPATEKLRSYQQHISRLAADAQVDLARVTEEHVQNTSRTARALAEEVTKAATEETQRGMRKQEETMRSFSDPFAHLAGDGKGIQARGNGSAGASMQSAQPGSGQAGNESARTGTQQATRPGAATRNA